MLFYSLEFLAILGAIGLRHQTVFFEEALDNFFIILITFEDKKNAANLQFFFRNKKTLCFYGLLKINTCSVFVA